MRDLVIDLVSLLAVFRDQVYYVLNTPPSEQEWLGGVGFVTEEMIKERLPSAKEESIKILLCGPPPMMTAMKKYLDEFEFAPCNTISKLEDQVFCEFHLFHLPILNSTVYSTRNFGIVACGPVVLWLGSVY